jgi:hypothetical protein
MRPGSTGNTHSSSNTKIVHTPGNPTTKSSERRGDERDGVDSVTRGEMVEGDLNRLIEKRHNQRVQSEGERVAEELWGESERRYFARQREENRIAWCHYYRNIAGALYARAQEYIVRAEKLENGHEEHNGHNAR